MNVDSRLGSVVDPESSLAASFPALIERSPIQIQKGAIAMVEPQKPAFDAQAFLASAGLGRRIVEFAPKETFFSQGDPADAIFYLQNGRAKVTIVSQA